MFRRPGGGRSDLMRPYSLHLPSLDEGSDNEAAPRSKYGSLRWQDAPSRPSSASYPQDPFTSTEWTRGVASKRNSLQISRSSFLPPPRRLSSATTPEGPCMVEPSTSSPSVLSSSSSSMDAQSRIPVPVQRRGTHQNKNFYVVGRKPVYDPGAAAPAQSDDTPSPSPGTISAKAFRRSVTSSHSLMQLDANASNLSFHSTASGGVGIRPRSKSHSSQIPQLKTKTRRIVSESTSARRGDIQTGKDDEENESELPYQFTVPSYDGIQQERAPWLNQARDHPSTPSLSDFGEAGSFFREIMDSREEDPHDIGGMRSGSKLYENLGPQDCPGIQDPERKGVCDKEPMALLQAMANDTQRMLDERYGALPEAAASPPVLPPPLELDLTRANTTKSATSTVPHPKRVPPPALPSPVLTPKPKASQTFVSDVSSPQSSNFVRISRRTPSSPPLAQQTRKTHKAKQPSLLGRLFSPVKAKSTPVPQPVKPPARPAWITGTFVIDPTLRVPGGIFSAGSLPTPTREGANIANVSGKKNLVLEVQNGGVDVTVKLVSMSCDDKAKTISTTIELSLLGSGIGLGGVLGSEKGGKGKKGKKNSKTKGDAEKEEVHSIVARIDAPNPRPPLYLTASTVASPSIEHAQNQGTPSKLDSKGYVLVEAPQVETPISPPTSPTLAKYSSPLGTKATSEGRVPSGQRLSRSSTGGNASPRSPGAFNGSSDANRISRSSTGRRLSKGSTASTSVTAVARPYHLPSSLVTNTSQGSVEEHDDIESSTSTLPFPEPPTAARSTSTVIASRAIGAPQNAPLAASTGAPDPNVDSKRLSSTSPIHLALPTTFRGPLSIAVLCVLEEGGVGAHVHMSPAVQKASVLLQETSGEGEGRQVWFIGGLGLEAQSMVGAADEDSIFSDEDDEEDNEGIFSGVWNMGGEVAKTNDNRPVGRRNGAAASKVNVNKNGGATTAPPKLSRLPKPRRIVSGREAPTPRSSESDSAPDYPGLGGFGHENRRKSRGSWGGERGYSPQEEWKGDRVDLVVGTGKIFLRFWDECVPGGEEGDGRSW